MGHIRSYLTSRVVATGAAVALLGGGAALANPASETHEQDESVAPSDLEDTVEDEEGEENREDEEDTEEDTEEDAEQDESVGPPDPEDEAGRDGDDELGAEATVEDTDERSETARAVHGALTGRADLSPGDPDFGEAVSENAREGGNDAAVSEAARGQRGNSPEGRGRPEGPSDDRGRSSAPGQAEDRASPPNNASDEDRVGPPDHAPARGFRAKGNDDANGTVDDDANGDEDANGTDTSTDSE